MHSASCVACYYVRACRQSARATALSKGKAASPKDRPVYDVCMSWWLRDGWVEEHEPADLGMPCSTIGPTAQQQLVQLMPACNPKGSATDGSYRPSEAVVCPDSVFDGQSCDVFWWEWNRQRCSKVGIRATTRAMTISPLACRM